jgi:uncharacterized membrane protein
MNKEESERAIKLLEKAIKEDYLKSSEAQEFYEMFKENKVGIFLETGELYSCNKKNADRLIKALKEDVKPNMRQLIRQVVEIATLIIGLLTALLGVI